MNEYALDKIEELREEKDAIILAHNYQIPEVQDIADYVGDSLGLSRKASETDAEVVVFCGVKFMAETASILCPNKTILLPEKKAGCELVRKFSSGELAELRKEHPEAEAVGYVNSSAEMKAGVDICCTSANAVKVVNSLDAEEVIFIPDQNLANYVSKNTEKEVIPGDSYCPTHTQISPENIYRKKELYPEAEVVVHPECVPDVVEMADVVGSTSIMKKYPQESDAQEFIIGTEVGMLYRLREEYPEKEFYPASEFSICPDMKVINLDKVARALENMKPEVKVLPEIREKAQKAVDRMMNG